MFSKKLFTALLIFSLVLILATGTAVEAAAFGSRTLRMGMRGADVAQLQEFLNEVGYREGHVDGVFGPLTYGSLIRFQDDHGLNADGIMGPATARLFLEMRPEAEEEVVVEEKKVLAEEEAALAADAEVVEEFNFTEADLDLFARIVHAESEGETFEGQVAVAASILNRIRSTRYPNTMWGVVYQVVSGRYQYSPVLDGRINRPAGESAKKAVQEALKGSDPSGGATGFYNPAKTSNQWVRQQPVTRRIGNHVFFV